MNLIAAILFAALGAVALGVSPAQTREVEGIAAIVNDEVISLYDVDQRVDLFFITSGLEKTPDLKERIRAQVLRSLIDERLQMQEADRVEIAIEDTEIEDNMERLAGQGEMTLDGIRTFLSDNNIKADTLKSQIRAELAWSQFVRRSFGGRIKIGEREIDEQYTKAVRSVNQTRYLVSEILLNLDTFADEQQVAQLSQEIVKQLQAGIGFAAVARQFSIAPTAARGGQLGWISTDQLDPALARVLVQLEPGRISPPIATPAGIYILALADRRKAGNDPTKNKFDVLTVSFQKDTKISQVDKFIADFRTCRRAQRAAEKIEAGVQRSGLRELQQLAPSIRGVIAGLEAGQVSRPVNEADGTKLFIVCDRKDDLGVEISREAIADNIFSQRIAMMARRHLRDLRRDAVVEYR